MFLEELASGVDPRKGCIEFIVLNVFPSQNNFPVGLISNPVYVQTPNSVSSIS